MSTNRTGWLLSAAGVVLALFVDGLARARAANVVAFAVVAPLLYILNKLWPMLYQRTGRAGVLVLGPLVAGALLELVRRSATAARRPALTPVNVGLYVLLDAALLGWRVASAQYEFVGGAALADLAERVDALEQANAELAEAASAEIAALWDALAQAQARALARARPGSAAPAGGAPGAPSGGAGPPAAREGRTLRSSREMRRLDHEVPPRGAAAPGVAARLWRALFS